MIKVSFSEVRSIGDEFYVRQQFDDSRFQKFIGQKYDKDLQLQIIYIDGIKMGLFLPNIYNITEYKHAEPSIFIQKRSIYSQDIIYSILYWLYIQKNVDSLIIKVYDDNHLMLTLLHTLNIKLSGKIMDISTKKNRGICFFQITKEFYLKMYEENQLYV